MQTFPTLRFTDRRDGRKNVWLSKKTKLHHINSVFANLHQTKLFPRLSHQLKVSQHLAATAKKPLKVADVFLKLNQLEVGNIRKTENFFERSITDVKLWLAFPFPFSPSMVY